MVIKMEQHRDEDGLPPTPPPFEDASKDRLVFIRNSKEFRMEKNRKHLRIIGNGNRVFIATNSGHLEVIGNSTSVWITRNAGTIHFTGNHGRIYLGNQSDVRVADYIGTDGRVTVLEESEVLKRATRKGKSRSRDSSPKKEKRPTKCDECRKEQRRQKNGCDKSAEKCHGKDERKSPPKEVEDPPKREFVYRKAFSIPIDGSLLKGVAQGGVLCGLHVSSEIKIYTSENGDISISSNQVVL